MPYREVKALLAERTRTSGGDCSTRTRVAGACNGAPINRERITGIGTEVCRLMEQSGRTFWAAMSCRRPNSLKWEDAACQRESQRRIWSWPIMRV